MVTGVTKLLRAIPESFSNALLRIGEILGESYWEIGDKANELAVIKDRLNRMDDDIKKNPLLRISMEDVHITISVLVKREVSPRTIEYYASIADFFLPEIRETYAPLPFSHFDLAKQAGSEWRKVLDCSMAKLRDEGKIMSREWVMKNCGVFDGDSFLDENPEEDEQDDLVFGAFVSSVRGMLEKVIAKFDGRNERITLLARDLFEAMDELKERDLTGY